MLRLKYDNLKVHSLLNTRRMVKFPIEVDNVSLTIFATYGRALLCNKITLHYFDVLLDVSEKSINC